MGWLVSTFNPLTALEEYIRPKTIAACFGYSASYSQNFENRLCVFDRGENFNQQQSHFKVKNGVGKNQSF